MLGMILLIPTGFGLAIWNSYRQARRRALSEDGSAGCSVTLPNGEKPFEEPRQFPTQHREGELYTAPLGLNGITRVRREDRLADGTLAPRWMFWRPRAGGSLRRR